MCGWWRVCVTSRSAPSKPTQVGFAVTSVFHHKRHPSEMGADEIRSFLADLAVKRLVSASTQTVSLSALLFLYRDVPGIELPYIEEMERAKSSKRLPVVFTREEVQ